MTQYTTLNSNLKRKIFGFSEKISKNMSLPNKKFVSQMIYGILSSNDSKLSNIARNLNEDISLKKCIERLSRNLKSFENGGKLFENYLKSVKSLLNSRSILVIDGGDITKTYAKSMEGLSTVRDGSTGEYKSGYHKLGITALSSVRKLPVPVYT